MASIHITPLAKWEILFLIGMLVQVMVCSQIGTNLSLKPMQTLVDDVLRNMSKSNLNRKDFKHEINFKMFFFLQWTINLGLSSFISAPGNILNINPIINLHFQAMELLLSRHSVWYITVQQFATQFLIDTLNISSDAVCISLSNILYLTQWGCWFMHQRSGSSLVQVMTCHLLSTKPLPQQMQTYSLWFTGPQGTNFHEIWINILELSLKKNTPENVVCKMAAILVLQLPSNL